MTDRYMAFTVTLDQNIREDDAKAIINAIKMVKHVRSVKPILSDVTLSVATERVRQEILDKIWKAIYPDWGKEK